MKRYKEEMLNRLLDKYENSKSFIGTNSVNQSFSLTLKKEFPEYDDDSHVGEIQAIVEAVHELESHNLAEGKKHKNGILYAVQLNSDMLAECYSILKRTPKKDTNDELLQLLGQYRESSDIVGAFSREQISRISANKKVEHFSGDIAAFRKLLKALESVTAIQEETYVRDFSVRVLGDSKLFEKMRSSICSILFDYGDFPDRETILEDLNIVKNPGHVFFKGAGVITLNGRDIDLSALDGDLAISTSLLKNLGKIQVTGESVVTIENLTTFNTYKPNREFVVYLGGYHNTARREFIKLLYSQNPSVKYYHYGDIDAGGFYILLHLRKKTGVNFLPLNMDVNTLSENKKYTKRLTENDEKRLKKLLGGEFDSVVRYMLNNHCKLEQEALD